MKLKEGHHIETKGLTQEQYEAFCEECIRQGFERGEHGNPVFPRKGWRNFACIGVHQNKLFHGDLVFGDEHPDKLLTYERAMSSESISDGCDLNAKRDELKQARQRVSELEQWFVDELELTP